MPNRAVLWTERLLLTAGVILIGGWATVVLQARVFGARQERRLERMIASTAALAAPPAAPGAPGAPRRKPEAPSSRTPRAPEDLVGRIEIPRLSLRAIVAEGVSSRTLRLAVGHLPGSALPGDDGNVVLAAHRDTFFRPLRDVRPGDSVVITTPEGRFEYTVESAQVVDPTRTDLLETGDAPALTLVTCYPFVMVGNAPDRFVVRARFDRKIRMASGRPPA